MTTPTVTTPVTTTPGTPTYESLLAAVTDPGGREILDPATGEVVGRVADRSADDLDRAVAAARAAQPAWAARTDSDRIDLLLRAADAIEAAAEPLAELLSPEQGKPLNGPNARVEVGACAAWLRATAATELPGGTVVDDTDTHAELHYRPVGVVGAIGPWNWPMMITVWQVAPALRMGNTVVVKPSEYTPLNVLALVEVLNSVLPADVLTAVAGGREMGARLSSHPAVDKLMFTGSTATGQAIIRSSADTVKRLTLELGGNDAGIVLPDVDPRAIAEGLLRGAFINTGQTCAALKRLDVHTDVYDEVCAALVDVAGAMPMGRGSTSRTCSARCRTARSTRSSPDWSTPRATPAPRSSSAATPTPTPPATSTRPPSWPTSTTTTRWWPRSSSVPRCRSCATRTSTRPSPWPTGSTSGWAPRCGAATGRRRAPSPPGSRPAPCGSTPTAACTP
jgi:acyl-CoA reductase-like NAD-dependent aldehyde dehydrogenase